MMNRRYLLILFLIGPFMMIENVSGQDSGQGYELLPAPDLWYNDVDGIRVGLRLRGQVPGTFNDGPHRLDLGIWLGTWFPTYPVSYYLQYTEPIPGISDFNSEGSISAISSIRTGFHMHGLRFDKRWQEGFNEDIYREMDIRVGTHRRFSDEYVQFPDQWQDDWVYYLGTGFEMQREIADRRGLTNARISGITGLLDGETFIQGTIELNNSIQFTRGFGIGLRGSGTVSNSYIPLEYGLFRSTASPIAWMNSGFTRAKGTIPTPWVNSGAINITGGPSIRGYNRQDIRSMRAGMPMLFQNFVGFNAELEYPNPLDYAFDNIPIAGDFLRLRSYVFYDGGTGLTLEQQFEPGPGQLDPFFGTVVIPGVVSPYFSNLGAGFMLSLNVPDYVGRPRGFTIRYEIPFWLSHPENGDDNLRYRGHLGIGAVISF